MLTTWRLLREQIAVFDEAVRRLAKNDPTCRLLMSVPGIGLVTVPAYVSTVEDPACFRCPRSALASIVRWRTSRSRVRCSITAAC